MARICDKCTKLGEDLMERFSPAERIFILSSVGSMMAHIFRNGVNPEQDKLVGSSVTTKFLLSFPGPARETLMEQLGRSTGFRIQMENCPHMQSVAVLQ